MALGITVDFNALGVRFTEQVDRMGQGLDNFRVRAESMSQRVDKAFSAIGVGLSVAGIAAFVKSGIDAADALNDMADRTGIAIEKLAGFEFAVGLGDTSMEAFAGAANKLSIAIAKNGEELAKLGISAKDPADAFLQFADVFSSIEDDQKRAAFGAQVLGKSYAEMAPLLQMGADQLRDVVAEGQRMSGVTKEQAEAAGKFNDQLEIMSARSIGLRTKISIGILEPLVAMAEEMDKSIEKTGQLSGSLAGLSDEYKDVAENAAIALGAMAGLRFGPLGAAAGAAMGYAFGRQMTKSVDDEIAFLQKKIRTMEGEGFLMKLIDDASGQDINLVKNQLDRLLKLKQELEKPVTVEPSAPAKSTASLDAINKFMSKGGDTADKKAQASADKLAESADRLIAGLQREIALRGDNSAAAAMEYDVINGSLKELSEGQKIKLLNLSAEKDALEQNIKAWQEYDDIIAQGLDLAKQQRADDAALQERLNQKFNAPLLDLNAGIDDVAQARTLGIIDESQAKIEYDKLGKAYNDSFIDPAKTATDDLSAYAEQAARNMQDAFADFLFDPFQEGTDGMLTSFLSTIQRMAAEYASSQIFDLFRDKDSGGGGLGSAIGSGLSSFLGGLFHDGGVVGYSGGTAAIPFSAAAFAPAYHTGGIAGLQPDEMFAKLRIGEEVLTRNDPRHRWNNQQLARTDAQPANVTVINNFTLNQPADRRTQDQIATVTGNAIKRALARNA
jgi:hypothetical protein